MELSSYNNFNISSDDFNSSSNESTTSCVPTNMDDFTFSTSNTTSIMHYAQTQRFGFVNPTVFEETFQSRSMILVPNKFQDGSTSTTSYWFFHRNVNIQLKVNQKFSNHVT